MKYSIWNFPTGETVAVEFESVPEARSYMVDPDKQCIVLQGTTAEDNRYGWGEIWECEHALPPEECVHCNPEYRHALQGDCPACVEEGKLLTWHNKLNHEQALKVLSKYEAQNDWAWYDMRDIAQHALDDSLYQCLACNHVHYNIGEDPLASSGG